jgi:ferredoxin
MIAARKFGHLHPVHTTNYLPEVSRDGCTGCGKCVSACPVMAMSLLAADGTRRPDGERASLNEDICLGCGVCVAVCSRNGIRLVPRKERVITPVTSTHKVVLMAIERGKLQDLIFDNQVLASHRAMAAILGVILKLPPLKQALASRQLRSRYVERLLARN